MPPSPAHSSTGEVDDDELRSVPIALLELELRSALVDDDAPIPPLDVEELPDNPPDVPEVSDLRLLLPVPPLDGWRIMADLWPGYGAIWARGNASVLAVVVIVLMFGVGGQFVWNTAAEFTTGALTFVLHSIGFHAKGP